MKKLLIIVAIVVVVAIALYSWFTGKYNQMTVLEESTTSAWAQVENVYQRRADLIPNLVNTVKGAADFEQETLTAVIEARSKASSIQVDPSKLTPSMIASFDQAQSGISSALSRLLVVVERYPDIKATAAFRDLQVQLEGTENRITVERQRFNEVIRQYNTYVSLIPNNLVAAISNFDKKGYFSAIPGAENAPVVEF